MSVGTQEKSAQQAAAAAEPHVQVVRGTPDVDELAALVAGLAAAAATAPHGEEDDDAHTRAARARWVAPGRLRGTSATAPGPDAWRWSLRG